VAPGARLRLASLTLSHGLLSPTDTNGGAAVDNHGTLVVTTSRFDSNSAPSQQGASGGAIQNGGVLTVSGTYFTNNSAMEGGGIFNQNQATITTSTFSTNKATIYGGGGIANVLGTTTVSGSTFTGNTGPGGGAIDNDATLSVSNSTFYNNKAGNTGGGAIVNFGTATITQSTLYGNSAPYGADIDNCCGMSMSLSMSVVAHGGGGPNCGGTAVNDAGYNLDDAGSCGFLASSGSLSGVDPSLSGLGNNGGLTQTMALRPDSPAVDAIPSSTAGCGGSQDQRGVSRPQAYGCDIGAYELIGGRIIDCSVAALVSAINAADSAGGGAFSLPHGCAYKLTAADNPTDGGNGLPVVFGSLTIFGNGATITRSSSAPFRFFEVAKGASLTLSSLTLSDGLLSASDTNGGAAIDNHGTLSLTATSFQNNVAPSQQGASGGAIQNSGVLSVATSTFTGNSAVEGGGIFNQDQATITGSTFTNNKATLFGGGGLVNALGTTTVSGSTFVGNTGPGGGAIDNDDTLFVSDSTFYNNKAGNNGGGAIVNFGSATVTQSTMSGNSSPYGANVYSCCGAAMSMSMTIVAHAAGGGANCGGTPVDDSGYNLDDASGCGFGVGSGSLSGVDPKLAGLGNNGGPTQTMALHADSPAVDAIPAGAPGCSGTQDQRGISRPQGAGCDVGAYELIPG
jgi:hypothetical protein